jgi:hypothetical protein
VEWRWRRPVCSGEERDKREGMKRGIYRREVERGAYMWAYHQVSSTSSSKPPSETT